MDRAEAVEEACDTLRLAALLERDEATGENWYRQHPLLRFYAGVLLRQDAAQPTQAHNAYADGVIDIADDFEKMPPEEWGH